MTITPIRSVSSHNPYSPNNFAYGLPNKHDKTKRDSSKPFDHLLARPVPFEGAPPRRDSKPLPTLTPDRSRAHEYELGHSQEMAQLGGRDSVEYYRRRNSKSLLGPASDHNSEEEFKPEDVYFAEDIEDNDYEEDDTVIHTVDGQLIKGGFASASTSEAGEPLISQGDNELTTSTIATVREVNLQGVSSSFP